MVIFTRGAEDIGAVKVRDERVIVPFSEPIYLHSYLAFDDSSVNLPLEQFKEFIQQEA